MAAEINLRHWLYWLFVPLLLFLPLLKINELGFLGNSDALFYSNILAMTSDALKSGIVFPSWLPDANAGFGSPAMMFYAPLAYLVTAVINLPLTPLHLNVGTQLEIGIYASQVLCGFTSFLWLRRSFALKEAFACSLLFVLLPYKLVYIYLHVNLAQLWALALLPWWMMAAEDMVKAGSRAVGAYALLAGAIYYTHPLTLIAFGWVPACYVLWFGRKSLKTILAPLGEANLLAVLLMGMQALPGHAHLGWISAGNFFEGKYSWRNNFYHVDVMLCAYYGIIAMLVGFAIWRVPAVRQQAFAKPGLFWIAMLGVMLFLTQRASTWVWEVVTPLQYLQFPAARLHAGALMGTVYLAGIWLTCFKQMLPLGGLAYRRITLLLLIAIFGTVTGWRVLTVDADPALASDAYLATGRAAKLVSTPVPIYKTHWGCIDAAKAFDLYTAGKVPPEVSVASGNAVITQLHWQPPQRIAFTADVSTSHAEAVLRQCYIPLWHEQDDLPLRAQPSDGLLTITLPRGHHDIEITMRSSPPEVAGLWIFVLALIRCAVLVGRKSKDLYKNGLPGAS